MLFDKGVREPWLLRTFTGCDNAWDNARCSMEQAIAAAALPAAFYCIVQGVWFMRWTALLLGWRGRG